MTAMTDKKRGLGRGLEALLGQATPRPLPGTPPPARDQLTHVPVDLLEKGRYQPRQDMREESLAELADSIRAQGVVQPIVVRPVGTPSATAPQRYEIIAGERRWRAAQMAGLADVPAVVRRVDDETAVAMALIENIQRENLNPLEEAVALSRLITEFELTHQQAAEAVGRSRVAVSNLLRLLELPDEVKTLVEQRQLEMGHARALLGADQSPPARPKSRGWSRRRASPCATPRRSSGACSRGSRPAIRNARGAAVRAGPGHQAARGDLADKLGAKVELHHGAKGKGKLVISYHSLDELDGILAHIR